MATPATEVVKVNWKQVCPWVALFRTLALALHVRQIVVGVIAAALMALGHLLFIGRSTPLAASDDVFEIPLFNWAPISFVDWTLAPLADLLRPIASSDILGNVQSGGAWSGWWSVGQIVLLLIWGGVVGGLAGGILVRRAAFDFCREESLSLTSAMHYVRQRWIDYVSAPGLPLVIVAGLGLLLALVGWLGWAVPLGNYLISATFLVWLTIGVTMVVLLAAVLFGWPMMIAAVSINGGDGFDALSRGFGFVLDRWRYYGCCLLIMVAYGILIFTLTNTVLILGANFLRDGLALGSGNNAFGGIPDSLPPGAWNFVIRLLLTGFGYSFFWANMTVIYLVLRKSVDNADLDDIYIEHTSPASDDLQALLNPRQPPAAPTLLPIIDPPAAP